MLGRSEGQASVELLAILPLAVTIALLVAQVLAVGGARDLAATAATAGAAALLQDGDPVAEARAAVPASERRDVRVRVTGRRVAVRLRPRSVSGSLERLLTVTATADAGAITPGHGDGRAMSVPSAVAVLAAERQGLVVGTALAAGLARSARPSPAVVLLCGEGTQQLPGPVAPGRSRSRRLAELVSGCGLPAIAAGNLVVAWLADDATVARAQVERVVDVAGGAPVVVAVEGPRTASGEAVLAVCALTVVVIGDEAPDSLAALAAGQAAHSTRVVRAEISATARALALTGVPVPAGPATPGGGPHGRLVRGRGSTRATAGRRCSSCWGRCC